MGGCFFIENPSTTLMFHYPDLRRALDLLATMAGMPAALLHQLQCSKVSEPYSPELLNHTPESLRGQAVYSVSKARVIIIMGLQSTARAAKIFRVDFWMKHFGHLCFKRTSILANSANMERLNRGRLNRSRTRCHIAKAEKHRDKSGKTRYKGSKALKSTQRLV